MFVIRPSRLEDSVSLFKLITREGAFGFTSLPCKRDLLEAKIERSMAAFQAPILEPGSEEYFFVLENFENSEIEGCCAILARTGLKQPNDYFAIEEVTIDDPLPHQATSQKLLVIKHYHSGPSILCSLFLSQKNQGKGLGKLLSLSRLLFAALEPQRFTPDLIADIRGIIEPNGSSPFWEAIGRHFLNVDFSTVTAMREADQSFISKILPEYPIYLSLLPKHIQKLVGEGHPHPNSMAALKILENEGFAYYQEIDPFDGGPKISAEVASLRICQKRICSPIARIEKISPSTPLMIASNAKLQFRSSLGRILKEGSEIIIDEDLAAALNIEIGEEVAFSPLNSTR